MPLSILKEQVLKSLASISAERPDLPERQRSIESCFNFSFERLTPEAKLLFLRLSIFPNGAISEAISSICKIDQWQLLAIELVKKGLIRFEEQRYKMHPLVRRFALDMLDKSGERKIFEENFAKEYANLIVTAFNQSDKEDAARWMKLIISERENIIAGGKWYFDQKDWDMVIPYSYYIDRVFIKAGLWTNRKEMLKLGIYAAKMKANKKNEAAMMLNLGVAEQDIGNFLNAEKFYRQSFNIYKKLNDKSGLARALHQLANIKQLKGNFSDSAKYYHKSFILFEELGDKYGMAGILQNLGSLKKLIGDYDKAEEFYKKSLLIYKELNSKSETAKCMHNLAIIKHQSSQYDEAFQLFQDSLAIFEELYDRSGIAGNMHELARLMHSVGQYDKAEQLYKDSFDISQQLGDKLGSAKSLFQLGILMQNKHKFNDANKYYNNSLNIFEMLEAKPEIARTYYQLGILMQDCLNSNEAERFCNKSLLLAKEISDRECVAQCLYQLGLIKHFLGNLDEAGILFNQSLRLTKKLRNQQGMALIMAQLGILFENQGNDLAALKNYLHSIALSKESNATCSEISRKRIHEMKNRIGDAKFLEIYQKALKYFKGKIIIQDNLLH